MDRPRSRHLQLFRPDREARCQGVRLHLDRSGLLVPLLSLLLPSRLNRQVKGKLQQQPRRPLQPQQAEHTKQQERREPRELH